VSGPQVAWLADGRRLHLNHGPIDLIVEAFGRQAERRTAYAAAIARFETILTELVAELAELRRPADAAPRRFAGPTARRMEAAVRRFHPEFITPMAAVAGAVADEVMAAMTTAARLDRAYVNDGGDVAIHLAAGQVMSAAIAGTGHGLADRIAIRAEDPVRGIATSGWRGRSFSLGIADAVTVLAADAAAADAAATMIANAVDLPGHPAIVRQPANELAPDTDLGARPVTTGVGALTPGEKGAALANGAAAAERYRRRGLIHAAALFLAGESVVVGDVIRPAATTSLGKDTPTPPRASPSAPLPHIRGVEEMPAAGLALFLSPVERGRGVARSRPEWGSTK
jgi:ApbE superfamily uncharacterized protein (UPF0280 family)